MIPRSHQTACIILTVQFFTIIAGTLITTGMLKLYGYPDADSMNWNDNAIFIRNWGWVVLLLPISWFGLTQYFRKTRGYHELSIGHTLLLILLTVGMVFFYFITAVSAGAYCNK